MRSASNARVDNLDLARSMAIAMVVAYHLFQQFPAQIDAVRRVTDFGEYGVDLFFVLSGWLIGGLYWREQRRFGDVEVVRFWLRRWTRTLPPYYVALLISWMAVYVARREPFDPAYLVFAQNYRQVIPFFLVSWSLAVEEHFYLLAPLLLLACGRFRWGRIALAGLGVLAPILFRLVTPEGTAFGYSHTATHLRMEGLILGFSLAYLKDREPGLFKGILRFAPAGLLLALAALAVLQGVGGHLRYVFWGTASAVFFAAMLVRLDAAGPVFPALSWAWRGLAAATYSVYLTNAWVINVARQLASRAPIGSGWIYLGLALVGLCAVGAGFYWLVERPAVKVRDILCPPRARTLTLTPAAQDAPP